MFLFSYQDDESDRRIVSVLLTEAGIEHVRAIVDMGQTVLVEIFEVQKDGHLETLGSRFLESPYATQSAVLSQADSSPEARFEAVSWFWQAYNSFYRALQRSLSEAALKLSLVSLLILFQLKNVGAEISMGELMRSLLIEKDSVSRASRQLLDRHYVARRRDTLDRRVAFLDLTTDGNELLLSLLPSILESISSLQGFSDPIILENLSISSADYVRRVYA